MAELCDQIIAKILKGKICSEYVDEKNLTGYFRANLDVKITEHRASFQYKTPDGEVIMEESKDKDSADSITMEFRNILMPIKLENKDD